MINFAKFVLLTGVTLVGSASLWDSLPFPKFIEWVRPLAKTPFEKISHCSKAVRISFFGDVFIQDNRIDEPKMLFDGVKNILNFADANVINLEGVIAQSGTRAFPDGDFALLMSPEVAELVRKFNIRSVTRANNHSMDYGSDGLTATNKALTDNGIQWAGVGSDIAEALKPMIIQRKGIKVAVLSLNMTYPREAWANETSGGVAYPYMERIHQALADAKKDANFLVVVVHWGEELSRTLRPYQPDMAHLFTKNGADLVIGHHPHIAQHIDTVNGKTVAYSLGNFIFTSLSDAANLGLAAHAEFCDDEKNKNVKVFFTPLDTFNKRTSYVTKPVKSSDFLSIAKDYVAENIFDESALFYFPDKDDIKPLKEWLSLLQPTPKGEEN